ncbi:MAG: hypothetical protein ACXV0U_11755 [Kineosporiaceae bacterium]
MSIWTKAKAKWDELLGRAEQIYGESHGDAAAEAHGEAMRLEGEAEEEQAEPGTPQADAQQNPARRQPARPDDAQPTA